MIISLEFINNILLYLCNNTTLFWEKSYEDLTKEISTLQTVVNIPIPIHNISEMPFPDMRIVCRDSEIQSIKEFIYGRPGALRKPSSYVLYGYGGVGKTALVLEAIKQVVQDLQDDTTINNYNPEFILFFTAKEEILELSTTTGKIQKIATRYSFKSARELIEKIFGSLNIESFVGYTKNGLIIIDNLETLSAHERKEIEEFIRFSSPQQIQYIITSRNEESYDSRYPLGGFEDDVSGRDFITQYTNENNFNISLDENEIQTLLQIAMGNTLVLVLCLRRLNLNLATISGIVSDMTAPLTVKHLEDEIGHIPANAFNIISEYMFKNSFEEIQRNYKSNQILLTAILKIFAVYPSDTIDLYTISMLSKYPFSTIDPVLELLCRYLIIEKIGEAYRLNQFAEKYIIQLFMPDSESYVTIQTEIIASTRKIQIELEDLKYDISQNSALKKIIMDWNVISDGDRIAVAKAYQLYGEVNRYCEYGSKFQVSSSLEESIKLISTLEQNTMHPYIKFQKARILQLIDDSNILSDKHTDLINKAYTDTIWTIKANPIYNSIKGTRSYASILWKYGIQLSNIIMGDADESGIKQSIRYLEESVFIFEQIHDSSNEYYMCLLLLGKMFLKLYLVDKATHIQYLRLARTVNKKLHDGIDCMGKRLRGDSFAFYRELQKYGRF